MAITNVKRLSELASTALATYAYFLNENELLFRLTKPDSPRRAYPLGTPHESRVSITTVTRWITELIV